MNKSEITHEHLKDCISHFMHCDEDLLDDAANRIEAELRHSFLIAAGIVKRKSFDLNIAQTPYGDFALLFTDMDAFNKAFPGFEVESQFFPFASYKKMMANSNLAGFIINLEGESYILPKVVVEDIEVIPESLFKRDDAYTLDELKELKGSIDNSALEAFIQNPDNRYDYEGLFSLISGSVMLAMQITDKEYSEKDGIIKITDSDKTSIYVHENAYLAAFTSDEKMAEITGFKNRYSQIVNFAYLSSFSISDDLEGVIINPGTDDVILTRDVILEFSRLIEKTCSNEKLNLGVDCMFEF